jgi:transposase
MRSDMVKLKRQSLSHRQVGERLGVSASCVKKFWRRFRHAGGKGLQRQSRRPHHAHPAQTPPPVRAAILQIKRQHPGWGAQFIQGELRRRRFHRIPHRRTIERFLQQFPDLPRRRYRQRTLVRNPAPITRLHQCWQMDFKVKQKLRRASRKYSFLNVRDVASTSSILKDVLPHGRSDLTSHEVIQVCRRAFRKWGCLPEAIRTDHGSCFVAPETSSFPTVFTLYLWGLGIEHELIDVRRPTQNGGVERDQRTLAEQFVADYPFRNEPTLQQEVEAFGDFQTRFVPSRSVRCQGRTAAEVAAQLDCRARPYKPRREVQDFDLQRIYTKLADQTWQRQVDKGGYIHLGHTKYYVGRRYRRQAVQVRCDPATHEFYASTAEEENIKRWGVRGISYVDIVNRPAPKPHPHQKPHKRSR